MVEIYLRQFYTLFEPLVKLSNSISDRNLRIIATSFAFALIAQIKKSGTVRHWTSQAIKFVVYASTVLGLFIFGALIVLRQRILQRL